MEFLIVGAVCAAGLAIPVAVRLLPSQRRRGIDRR
jgi:hypothetical protein